MKTPQEKLAEKLYELLPHKKELKFGCEVYIGMLNKKLTVIGHSIPDLGMVTPEEKRVIVFEQGTDSSYGFNEKDLTIIGQPLRLADLLLAIGRRGDTYHINGDGGLQVRNQIDGRWIVVARYNLSQDNILNQSDEFCEFCLDLIK